MEFSAALMGNFGMSIWWEMYIVLRFIIKIVMLKFERWKLGWWKLKMHLEISTGPLKIHESGNFRNSGDCNG